MTPSVCVMCPTMNQHSLLPKLIAQFEKQTFSKDDAMLLIVDETPTVFTMSATLKSPSIVYVHLPSASKKAIHDLENEVIQLSNELKEVQKETQQKKNRQKELTTLITDGKLSGDDQEGVSTKRAEFRVLIDSVDILLKKNTALVNKLAVATAALQKERDQHATYTPLDMLQLRQTTKEMALQQYAADYCVLMSENDEYSSKYVSSMVHLMKSKQMPLIGFNEYRVRDNRTSAAFVLDKHQSKYLQRSHVVSFTKEYGVAHHHTTSTSFNDPSVIRYTRSDNLVLCKVNEDIFRHVKRFFKTSTRIAKPMI